MASDQPLAERLKKVQEESKKNVANKLDSSCNEIEISLRTTRETFDAQLEERTKMANDAAALLKPQVQERTRLTGNIQSEIGKISGAVPQNLVLYDPNLREALDHKALSYNTALVEDLNQLSTEEAKIRTLIYSLYKTGEDLQQEQNELASLDLEIGKALEDLEKKMNLTMNSLRTEMEGKKKSVFESSAKVISFTKEKCDALVAKMNSKQIEVREAITQLRTEAGFI